MFSLLVLAMCTLQFAPAQAAEGRTPLIREMNADVMGSRDIMAQSQLEPDLGGMRPIAAVRKEVIINSMFNDIEMSCIKLVEPS